MVTAMVTEGIESRPASDTPVRTQVPNTIADVVAQVRPAVVSIAVVGSASPTVVCVIFGLTVKPSAH